MKTATEITGRTSDGDLALTARLCAVDVEEAGGGVFACDQVIFRVATR